MIAPRIYIRNFAGLANRIEALATAFALRAQGGHEVVLDWPELDMLRVSGTQVGRMPWWRRPLRYKVRRFNDDAAIKRAARHRTIDLRRFYGDAPLLDQHYPAVARALGVAPQCAAQIAACFAAHAAGHPVVGVHIRRGDYGGEDAAIFDPATRLHAAVPLWWHLALIDRYRKAYPGVRFFAALNGPRAEFPELAGAQDIFTLEIPRQGFDVPEGHRSDVHPVADLFALACCPVVLATPGSSFSHLSINLIGPKALAVVPVAGATAASPSFAVVDLHHRRVETWIRTTRGTLPAAHALPMPAPAQTDWLHASPAAA